VGIILIASSLTQAQVSVNVNIGTPPSWGPKGYSNVEYYYLPDVQAYYDIRASQFIYLNVGGLWIRSRNLPNQYRNYDLYNGYKVALTDYHGAKPYTYFKNHRTKYYRGYKGNPQIMIGNRDTKFPVNNDNRGKNNNDKWNNSNRGNDNKFPVNNDNHGRIKNEKWNNGNRGNDNKVPVNNVNQGRNNNDLRNNSIQGKDNRGQGNDKH
jgi:hypothetical protein